MSLICPNCKNEFGPDDVFCGVCGRRRPEPLQKVQTSLLNDNPTEDGEEHSSIPALLAETAEDLPPELPAPEAVPQLAAPLPAVQGPTGFDALAPVASNAAIAETKPEVAPAYKPQPDPWLCKQCNTLNIAQDEYCNVCGAMRVSTPLPTPAASPITQPLVRTPEEIMAEKLAIALAPRKADDPRQGWRYLSGQSTNEGISRLGTANEDSTFKLEINRMFESKPESFALYIVADGMGGQDAGEVASRMVIETVAAKVVSELVAPWVGGQNLEQAKIQEILKQAVQDGHHRVRNTNLENQQDSGTTITTACLVNGMAHFANVGDSRTYLFRKPGEKTVQPEAEAAQVGKTLKLSKRGTNKLSINGQPNGADPTAATLIHTPELDIVRVTRDQSLVQNLVDMGQLTIEQVYNDPRRNVVLNAVGSPDEDIPVDTYLRELVPGDWLLLCSDGMWEMARDEAIAERILSLDSPQATADELVALACRNGGADNVSVIVVQVERV